MYYITQTVRSPLTFFFAFFSFFSAAFFAHPPLLLRPLLKKYIEYVRAQKPQQFGLLTEMKGMMFHPARGGLAEFASTLFNRPSTDINVENIRKILVVIDPNVYGGPGLSDLGIVSAIHFQNGRSTVSNAFFYRCIFHLCRPLLFLRSPDFDSIPHAQKPDFFEEFMVQ